MTYSVKTIYPQFKSLTAHRAVMKRFETKTKELVKRHFQKEMTAPQERIDACLICMFQNDLLRICVFKRKDYHRHLTIRYEKEKVRPEQVWRFEGGRLVEIVPVTPEPESMYYERRGAFYETMMERDRVLGMRRSLPDEIVNEIMSYL